MQKFDFYLIIKSWNSKLFCVEINYNLTNLPTFCMANFKNMTIKQPSLLILIILIALSCVSNKTIQPAAINGLSAKSGWSREQVDLIAATARQFPNESQFAVAIIEGDKVAYYGTKRQHNQLQQQENAGSVFEIGSISKVFTTHLMVNHLNKGEISSLEQPIREKLGFAIVNDPAITFKQLANHTSGLPSVPSNYNSTIFNAKNPYKDYSIKKLEQNLTTKLKLVQPPGEKYIYSNYGMGLLQYIISGISHKDYESLLREQILDALMMRNTTSNRARIAKDILVKPYDRNGKPTSNWDMGALEGAGAILSSVEDLSKYATWCFDALNGELAIMKEKTFTINDKMDIALAWHIVKHKTTQPFLWHNGGTGGYKSSMGINPESKKSVIILTNVGATNNSKKYLIDELCYDLMKSIE